jgi:hypothetical protein
MTLWDLTLAMFRRWPIVVAGALITCAFGLLAIRDSGIYWTRTEVILLSPKSWYPNRLQVSPWEVTTATGVVVKRVVGDGTTVKYASPDVTMIGTSTVREGVWIRQEDDGGQWSMGLTSPVIIVEAVGPTAQRAEQLRQVAVTRIARTLQQLQKQWGADSNLLIASTEAPTTAETYFVDGSKIRALAMTAALGIGSTVGVVLILESRSRKKSSASNAADSEFIVLAAGPR